MTSSRVRTRYAFLAFCMAFTAASLGAPPVTTIQDTLYLADGTLFNGTLIINWRSFEGPDLSNIPTNTLTTQVVNGSLFVKLVPTTTAPSVTYYSVRYVSAGSVQFTELWSVPPGATPLRVRDVRIQWPPPTTAAATTQVLIDDVDGLRDELDARPVKGLGYTPSRAAVIGATGELEAAAGEAEDCIRADGTAVACSPGFVDSETPAGEIDGLNTAFLLSGTPDPPASLQLYRNGVLQKRGLDYTVSVSAVDFLPGSTPQTGDILLASYRTGGS